MSKTRRNSLYIWAVINFGPGICLIFIACLSLVKQCQDVMRWCILDCSLSLPLTQGQKYLSRSPASLQIQTNWIFENYHMETGRLHVKGVQLWNQDDRSRPCWPMPISFLGSYHRRVHSLLSKGQLPCLCLRTFSDPWSLFCLSVHQATSARKSTSPVALSTIDW